ncbi:MAG: ester cyclase [Caldilineaceae bacterium]|nr:ester cyclase [Caldilineaceae bacterium]
MSVEENKAVIRAWLAARNAHDVEAAVAQWDEEQQAGLRTSFDSFTKAFPDVQIAIKEMIGEGNKVAVWWAFHATHLGSFQNIAASGKSVEWDGLDLYTLADHKITSLVRKADSRSLLQQLGVQA